MKSGDDYTDQLLFDLAQEPISDHVELGRNGPITGVVIPHWVQGEMIMNPEKARKLAAQLLRAADLHDAIQDSAP
jgi:hypothetical protein